MVDTIKYNDSLQAQIYKKNKKLFYFVSCTISHFVYRQTLRSQGSDFLSQLFLGPPEMYYKLPILKTVAATTYVLINYSYFLFSYYSDNYIVGAQSCGLGFKTTFH